MRVTLSRNKTGSFYKFSDLVIIEVKMGSSYNLGIIEIR